MALKQALLAYRIGEKKRALEILKAKSMEFEKKRAEMKTREDELTQALDEVNAETAEEDKKDIETAVDAFAEEQKTFEEEADAHEQAVTDLEEEVKQLEDELEKLNEKVIEKKEKPKEDEKEKPVEERKDYTPMNVRAKMFGETRQEREAFIALDAVKGFLERVRSTIKNRRSITGAELAIPTVLLPMIREVTENTSKLLKYVNLQRVKGDARVTITGTIPRAVWTEMCAKLNEMNFDFYMAEVDGYKVGGFVPVCNAVLEDNDIDLAGYIVNAFGVAIARELDLAILYGTGTKMPLGIVTRLAQTTKPGNYPEKGYPWKAINTTNIVTVSAANSTGTKLFQQIVTAFGAAKNKYGAEGKFWAMNSATKMKLVAEAMAFNANGAIVAGVENAMPVVGGAIEVIDEIPNDVIIAGYGSGYLMVERAGMQIDESEHVRFIEDETVFRVKARYDGKPVIPEAFVAIGINGATVSAAAVTFAPDTANAEE